MKKSVWVAAAVLGTALTGCDSGGDANKSWSEFSRCMAGEGIAEPSQVAARLRSIELSERQPPKSGDAKTQWPGRCESYADALFTSLGNDVQPKLLKGQLKGQLGCKEEQEKPGCAFPPDGEILPEAAKMWETAAAAGLKGDVAVQVPLPKFDLKLLSPDAWRPLGGKGYEVADTLVTNAGVLRLLLKSHDGPLLVCDAAGEGVKCAPVSKDIPSLAFQSVKLLNDDEAIVTGLTAEGRQGFLAATGKVVTFRGIPEFAVRDGVVIEDGEGGSFVAVKTVKGKARGEAPLKPEQMVSARPIGVDGFVSWTEGKDDKLEWRFSTVVGKKLKDAVAFKGNFAGTLSPCSSEKGVAAAIWGRADGEREAKPTAGKETAVFASFLEDGTWSNPVNGEIPFKRRLTASRCTGQELDVYWAGPAAGADSELAVGQLVCSATECKTDTSTWSSFGVKRWLAAGAVGDKFALVWTTSLGDTRIRVGDPASFATAKEAVLFEGQERGGPVFRDLKSFFTAKGAYLLVADKGPTLLRIDPAGSIVPMASK